MKDNGTDRDVALLILSGLDSCATLVATINDNLYVPHITTQPVSVAAADGEDAVFTIVANNVSAYQWQYKPGNAWQNSTMTGNDTDTFTVEVNTQRRGYDFRCKITGKDGSIIYSDVVNILQPEANG